MMGRPTWLTRYGECWRERTNSSPNWKRLAFELGILKREGKDEDEIYARWCVFCESVELRHLSPTYFRTNWNAWTPDAQHRKRIEDRLDAENRRKEAALNRRHKETTEFGPEPPPRPLTDEKRKRLLKDADRHGLTRIGDVLK